MGSDNPVHAFLRQKTAAPWADTGGRVARGMGKALEGAVIGTGASVAAAALAGGAAHIFDAATKKRDFQRMLAFSKEVRDAHTEAPGKVNQLYSSLRTINPSFARDPIVASSYVERMLQSPLPGGVLTDALSMRDRVPSPIRDALVKGLESGIKSHLPHPP